MSRGYYLSMSRNVKPRSRHTPIYLFTIRVWVEKLEDGSSEWRGKVQNVTGEEGYYFRGWLDLADILQTLVTEGNLEKNR